MPRRPPRDPKKVASFAELRSHYSELWRMYEECSRMRSADSSTAKHYRKSADEAKQEAKGLKRSLQTITRKQAQAEKLKSTASWSGCALGINTLLFQTLHYYEQKHAIPDYLLESDFVFAGCAWLLTSLFAAAAHAYYTND